jgi:hypothetical protein
MQQGLLSESPLMINFLVQFGSMLYILCNASSVGRNPKTKDKKGRNTVVLIFAVCSGTTTGGNSVACQLLNS